MMKLGAPVSTPAAVVKQTATQLESYLLKQVLQSSGAFSGDSSVAGSTLTQGMFVDALADAVAKAGGLGIAPLLEKAAGIGSAPPPALGPGAHGTPGVTSGFGQRLDPITGQRSNHTGVDLGAPEGTPIPAAADGVVLSAGERGGYGNAVEVGHADGSSTLYAHMSEVHVTPGDRVEAGETLGLVGQTGRTTGPHLHLEVRRAGHFVDPRVALKAYGLRVESTGGGEP